ncbi:MAG TPA: hypothetical protein VK890_05890, partial [Bacteroidia bacterium]|nr:hypothetical protein [Bacteroidia bacterium]
MKKIVTTTILFFTIVNAFAIGDTSRLPIPIGRARFHDRIDEAQILCDKADGRKDGIVHVSGNDEINLQVTDAIMRKVNTLQDFVEDDTLIATNNDKVKYLTYIEKMVDGFLHGWRTRELNPALAPLLVDNFLKILKADTKGESMVPYINDVPFEVGMINAEIFNTNKGYDESKKILFLKFCAANPDRVLSVIRPYVNEPFADSLLAEAALRNPVQLYSYAQAYSTPEGKLIHRSTNPVVKQIAELSQTPNALLYFPFLDNILKGVQTIDSIKKFVGNGVTGYDSIGYYKLLVK